MLGENDSGNHAVPEITRTSLPAPSCHQIRSMPSRLGVESHDSLLLPSYVTSQYTATSPQRGSLASWQVRDAKARFSEFLDATMRDGPQVVTRRGIETAVLVSIEEWNRLQRAARPGLKTLLLAPEGRFENLVAERGDLQRRPPVEFK